MKRVRAAALLIMSAVAACDGSPFEPGTGGGSGG